jgi:lysyl-tRNA synthetase class 2
MSLPFWHPDALARRRPALAVRGRLMGAIRARFEGEGFTEVDTPALQVSPGLEAHLHAFATTLTTPEGETRTRYLHTSPEFTMKKLVAGGMERIFQLGHVFRNGERARRHSPDFTMLEWYRAGAGTGALIEDCAALLRLAADEAGCDRFQWDGIACDPRAPIEILSVAEAFQRHCGIDVLATAPEPLRPDAGLLGHEADRIGIRRAPSDTWEDIFFRIMLERIEPELGKGRATALVHYPVSLAALARPLPEDPRLADRFELYACGVELANAFGELTDAGLQRRRFEADMDLKERLYGERYPIDEDFLAALAFGLPDCAGAALGFDRLLMLAVGAGSIDDVLWAPVQ